jgi:hypothetical protein
MYLALMIVLSVGVSVGLAASSRNDQSFENRVEVLKVQFLACSMANWGRRFSFMDTSCMRHCGLSRPPLYPSMLESHGILRKSIELSRT